MYGRDRNGIIERAHSQGWLSGFDFSVLIQDFLPKAPVNLEAIFYDWIGDTVNALDKMQQRSL